MCTMRAKSILSTEPLYRMKLIESKEAPVFPHATVESWYRAAGRQHLPWRQTSDPYPIWVSEVMLQQTQVSTVLARYYFPFLQRFPTLQALARAPQEDVLKAWEGLGYYSRARHLHQAARISAPHLPTTIEGLMALPGIGRNTAHAIAAFAYRQNVPVMEANVKRVLHRLAAREQVGERELWEMAVALVNPDDPFTHNQAMMDIGALLCTPRAPRCLKCPLASFCQGKAAPERYPARKQKKPVPVRERILLIAEDTQGRIYLAPRSSRFLGGLYGLPEYDGTLRTLEFGSTRLDRHRLTLLGGVTHTYSHFRLEATVLHHKTNGKATRQNWHTQEAIAALPLSRVDHKALALHGMLISAGGVGEDTISQYTGADRPQQHPKARFRHQ